MKNLLRQFSKEGWQGERLDGSDAFDEPQGISDLSDVSELTELVYKTDSYGKSLTGRTPEQIYRETGIPKEKMFPENAKILYVGDPWQRMGKSIDSPNLFIIDYEFGDVISFVTNNKEFRAGIAFKVKQILKRIELLKKTDVLSSDQVQWLTNFETVVSHAGAVSEMAKEFDDYPKAAEAWHQARQLIESRNNTNLENVSETKTGDPGDPMDKYDELSLFCKEVWYACIHGERGFRDIPDYNNIIVPKISELKKRLQIEGLNEEEISKRVSKSMKGWVEDIRLKKIPEQANVIEAVFPALPFKDESFDRFVASWSISAHTFSALDKDGFSIYWKEICRVLKHHGEAYIFPLHYASVDLESFATSLKESASQYNFDWCYIDAEGIKTENFYSAETLQITKDNFIKDANMNQQLRL